jgi:hypothetical protein
MKKNFITNKGVGQCCILSPIIFLLVLDRIIRKALGGRKRGIQWNMRDRLEDLEFADDICLLAQRLTDMKETPKQQQGETELARLNMNVKKTKEIRVNITTTTEKLSIGGKEIEQVDSFTCLGSIVISGGGIEDFRVWIRKANGAFIQLYPIWKSKMFYTFRFHSMHAT